MVQPTENEYRQYDALVAAGADEGVAAYIAGVDECGCVMPWQSCRICRGAAKMQNAASDLAMLLEVADDAVQVTMLDNLMIVNAPNEKGVVIDNIDAGIRVLTESGRYREYTQHIGGRTTPLAVAEPVKRLATGPTFTRMHPEPWKAAEQ